MNEQDSTSPDHDTTTLDTAPASAPAQPEPEHQPEHQPEEAPAQPEHQPEEAPALPPPPMPIETFVVSPYAVAPHEGELAAAIDHVLKLPESSKREAVLANLRANVYERAQDMYADIDDLDLHAEDLRAAAAAESAKPAE